MLESANAAVQGLNAGYCAGVEAQLAGGILYDSLSSGVFKQVGQNAAATPDGLTPIPLFPPFLTNRQVLLGGLTVPSPGPVSMPVPDFIQLAPTAAGDDLAYASERRLFENILTGFNDYTPLPVVRDISCSLAGVEDAYTQNLHLYAGHVLMIGGGRAFGGFVGDQAAAFTGAASVVLDVEPAFGHVDHFFTPFHRHFVERPILRWLEGALGW